MTVGIETRAGIWMSRRRHVWQLTGVIAKAVHIGERLTELRGAVN
jgi:hypothetical protein